MAHTHTETGKKADGGQQAANDEMAACIEVCISCHRICLETLKGCLSMGGEHAGAEHVTLLLDCAQICATSADFMERGSSEHQATCAACASICRACAQSCRQLGGEEMESCAKACDECAGLCESMVAKPSSSPPRH
jgi:hypothetical protein